MKIFSSKNLFETKDKRNLQKRILALGFRSIENETEKGTPASVGGPGERIKWKLGLIYLKFPKKKTFNLKLWKFREEDQMEQKFPVFKNFGIPRTVVRQLRKIRMGNGIEVRKLNLQQALHISV